MYYVMVARIKKNKGRTFFLKQIRYEWYETAMKPKGENFVSNAGNVG